MLRVNNIMGRGKSTTDILSKLRHVMKNTKYVPRVLDAYIVPTGDAHQSEYVAKCDSRRAFISGFTGSAGTAVIAQATAGLWTDGRYYIQADQELDANWELVKEDGPTKGKWLSNLLSEGSAVGCDPALLSYEQWTTLEKDLKSNGLQLLGVKDNLIDLVWEDRPPRPTNSLLFQPLTSTGKSWQDKVLDIRHKMKENGTSAEVFTALDDIAWLFNLRGSDIIYNPVFFSFAIVTTTGVLLFIDEKQVDSEVCAYLEGVEIKPYGDVYTCLADLAEETSTTKVWVHGNSSYFIVNQIAEEKRFFAQSSVSKMKAVKNSVELNGMENCHIRDAVALCQFLMWMEKEVPTGTVTEMSAADKVDTLRSQQEDFVSLSFDTISSTGPNAAIIHYKPNEQTDALVTSNNIYLVDSGAQYRDGTTDVTRTVHFETPTHHQQECFTRVLKGHINLARAVFPNGVRGHRIDSLARMPLWEAGLDYLHGTGHGVGSFLNVHEGPCGIGYRVNPNEVPLEEGMVLSNEPGYYEQGNFGIRIESLYKVVKAKTKHNFANKGYLTFEPITLVPIQKKLIDPSLLTKDEIEWVNHYHRTVMEVIGTELVKQGKSDVLEWLQVNCGALDQ